MKNILLKCLKSKNENYTNIKLLNFCSQRIEKVLCAHDFQIMHEQSKEKPSNFDLALSLNHSPEELTGYLRGMEIQSKNNCSSNDRAINLLYQRLSNIKPCPANISVHDGPKIMELRISKRPQIIIKLAYADHLDDMNWLQNNREEIAMAISYGILDYFNIPISLQTIDKECCKE